MSETPDLSAVADEVHPSLKITKGLLKSIADLPTEGNQTNSALAMIVAAIGQLETLIRGLEPNDNPSAPGNIFPD